MKIYGSDEDIKNIGIYMCVMSSIVVYFMTLFCIYDFYRQKLFSLFFFSVSPCLFFLPPFVSMDSSLKFLNIFSHVGGDDDDDDSDREKKKKQSEAMRRRWKRKQVVCLHNDHKT